MSNQNIISLFLTLTLFQCRMQEERISVWTAKRKEIFVTELPMIPEEMVKEFVTAHNNVYPKASEPKRARSILRRMIERLIETQQDNWRRFLDGPERSVTLTLDKYTVTTVKGPLRVHSVTGVEPTDPPIDLREVRISRLALKQFEEIFPNWVRDGDVEASARRILLQATENRAITQKVKAAREKQKGPARYFRFSMCRFVIRDSPEDPFTVVRIELVPFS